jgi:RNA polymerase sigma factor for flagellar operon FliA
LLERALPVVEDVLVFIRRRHRCTTEEAEEFAGFVRLKLIEDDYRVLRRFDQRSSLKTFLSVVLQRLFLDFRRQQWGVWRPSAEARRLGPTAVRLDTIVNRDGFSVDEAVQVLRSSEGEGVSEQYLRDLADRLPARQRRRRESERTLESVGVSSELLVEGPAWANERYDRARALREALHAALRELPAEDAMVLRLRFVDGFTVARIAELLKLAAKPLYRRLDGLLSALHKTLIDRGFRADELTDLLGDRAFDEERSAFDEKPGLESV